jgi:hypothetical protein
MRRLAAFLALFLLSAGLLFHGQGQSSQSAGQIFRAPLASAVSSGNTGPINQTTLFSPAASGLYRIAAYFQNNSTCASGTVDVNYYWTDETGTAQTADVTNSNLSVASGSGSNVQQAIQLDYTVYSRGGQPIQYSTTAGLCAGGSLSYDFYVEVTQ